MPHVSHTAEGWQVAATGDVYVSLREALDGALAGVATHEKPAYFRDADGVECGVFRWLPAAEEEDAPLRGVRLDSVAIEEMAASLNSATRAIPIDGGTPDSPPHGTVFDPSTPTNGRGHWAVVVLNARGKTEVYLWAELLPSMAREVDVGRIGEGSVHVRWERLDGETPRGVEWASHALLNDPGIQTLAPANSVRDAERTAQRTRSIAGRVLRGGTHRGAMRAQETSMDPDEKKKLDEAKDEKPEAKPEDEKKDEKREMSEPLMAAVMALIESGMSEEEILGLLSPKSDEPKGGDEAAASAARTRAALDEVKAEAARQAKEIERMRPIVAAHEKREREDKIASALRARKIETPDRVARWYAHAEKFGVDSALSGIEDAHVPPMGASLAPPQASRSAAPEESATDVTDVDTATSLARAAVEAEQPELKGPALFTAVLARARKDHPRAFSRAARS